MTPRLIESRVFVRDECVLGEGPFWHDGRLWWVDIDSQVLLSVDERGDDRRAYPMGRKIGVAMPCEDGKFVVGLEDGIGFFNPADSSVRIVASPEEGVAGSRFNDGKCDPVGRFLVGTLNMNGVRQASALYALDREGSVSKLFGPVSISNGLAWSADGRMLYYIDTLTFEIAAFPYNLETGELGERQVVVRVPEDNGYPDGMTIDTAGNLWVGHWGGSAVRCWSPTTGECLAVIPVPASCPSCCCFGGPNLDRLFITSARVGEEPEKLAGVPLAGSVFVCEPGVRGAAVQVYRGSAV